MTTYRLTKRKPGAKPKGKLVKSTKPTKGKKRKAVKRTVKGSRKNIRRTA